MDIVTDPDSGQLRPVIPRIWEGIPPRNKNFTGRVDVLNQLRSRVTSKITAVLPSEESPPQALQGLGGVGKTAVAIEYAWKYRIDYDLVCWIRADQMPLVRSSLAALATQLGLVPSASGIDLTRSEEHTSELQSHVNLVCRLLLEKKKKNILYVFVVKKKEKYIDY